MRRLILKLLIGSLTVIALAGIFLYAGVGCSTTMAWGLEAGVYDTETANNGTFVFRGEIGMTGSTGQPEVRDVDLVFLAANGSSLGTVPVGDFGISAQRSRNVTVRLPERPHRIEPRPGRIDAEPDAEWYVVGLAWTGDRYEQDTLRTNPKPWYC